jgi:hypothetical protein
VCDNFNSGAVHAAIGSQFQEDINMVEELEKEYAGLKDKVRELREYL